MKKASWLLVLGLTAPTTAFAQPLQADTLRTTASGATFTAPKGWTVTPIGAAIVLKEPGEDLTVSLVEIAGSDGPKAIAAAWKQATPKFARTIEEQSSQPAADGWDGTTRASYETTSAESRIVKAIARLKGHIQYVTLLDGSRAAMDRREAEVFKIASSFKPAGVAEESFRGRKARPLRVSEFSAFVEDARAKSSIPGAAVAVIQGGKIVLQQGFGVRAIGTTDPVTPDTLFAIGSISKSLTTLMMASEVDARIFDWNTPVTQLLPSFALADREATKKLSLRYSVCACTGLPSDDLALVFGYGKATPESRIRDMRAMAPTTAFGETFQYSNLMVAAGGFAAGHTAFPGKELGDAYDSAMQSRVFTPLGMRATTLNNAVAEQRAHASPHGLKATLEHSRLPIETELVSVRPAGGIWSSAHDMARAAFVELANGKTPEGVQVVSKANLLERRAPQVAITDTLSYGLGLYVEEDHGVQVVWHNGGTFGFSSAMFLLPDYGVGAVVLTNAGGAGLFLKAVRRRLMELLFDGEPKAQRDLELGLKTWTDSTAKEVSKLILPPQRAWVESLAGTYSEPRLGSVTIRVEGADAIFDTGEWKSTFAQRKESDGHDVLVLLDPPLTGFELAVGEKNKMPTLTAALDQQKYVFESKARAKEP